MHCTKEKLLCVHEANRYNPEFDDAADKGDTCDSVGRGLDIVTIGCAWQRKALHACQKSE